MRTQGVKVLDRVLETNQIHWMLVHRKECPDEDSERLIIQTHFLVPHERWTTPPAFVGPVRVRRSRSWVLFSQECGVGP